jgi:hypothetical protein
MPKCVLRDVSFYVLKSPAVIQEQLRAILPGLFGLSGLFRCVNQRNQRDDRYGPYLHSLIRR